MNAANMVALIGAITALVTAVAGLFAVLAHVKWHRTQHPVNPPAVTVPTPAPATDPQTPARM